jgi:hypothetical protein
MILLHSTNAITETVTLGGKQDLPDIVIGEDPFRLHRLLRGDDAVQSGLRFHNADRSAVCQIVFDEMGKLMIHRVELCFVDADNEWSQPEQQLSILLSKQYETTLSHPHELGTSFLYRKSDTFRYHVQRFPVAAQLAGQRRLFGREDLPENRYLNL